MAKNAEYGNLLMNCPFCQQLIGVQNFQEYHKKPQRQACFYGCSYMYYASANHIVEYHITHNVEGNNYRLHGWHESTELNILPKVRESRDKFWYVQDLLRWPGKEVLYVPSFIKFSNQEELDGLIPRLLKLKAFS